MTHFKIKKILLSLGIIGIFAGALFFIVTTVKSQQARAERIDFVYKEPPRPGILAKIGDEFITEEGLISPDKLDFFELEKRKYELLMDRLNRLLVEKLVGADAKKANLSIDDFINQKIIKGPIKITEAEYKKLVEDKHIPESQINPQVKERIYAYLQTTKKQELITSHVAKLTHTSPVEVYFKKPKLQIEVDAGAGPVFGKSDAKVTIVEFSDFQCPFCSKGAETVSQIQKKYGNKVKIVFRHFPLPMHPEARPASEASFCVNEQSSSKFWKFHDLAFKNQDKLSTQDLQKYAKEAGADIKKFTDCVNSKKFAQMVQNDMVYGEKIGVKSTPTFFVNGQLITGAVPIEQFSEMIDEELKIN